MLRKLYLVLCVLALASITASAGSYIPFSGSGSSGTLQTGQPFTYNGDGGMPIPNWGIPGVLQGTAVWNGPDEIGFLVMFNLPVGTIIDPNQVILGSNSGCAGGPTGGTTFCTQPFSAPWIPKLIGTNGIEFDSDGGDVLTKGDLFFVNIFFEGPDPNGVSFAGAFYVPEPSSLMLIGPGLLALMACFRRKLLI